MAGRVTDEYIEEKVEAYNIAVQKWESPSFWVEEVSKIAKPVKVPPGDIP